MHQHLPRRRVERDPPLPTYGPSRMLSTTERTRRATRGISGIAIATMIVARLGRQTATSVIANRMRGSPSRRRPSSRMNRSVRAGGSSRRRARSPCPSTIASSARPTRRRRSTRARRTRYGSTGRARGCRCRARTSAGDVAAGASMNSALAPAAGSHWRGDRRVADRWCRATARDRATRRTAARERRRARTSTAPLRSTRRHVATRRGTFGNVFRCCDERWGGSTHSRSQ